MFVLWTLLLLWLLLWLTSSSSAIMDAGMFSSLDVVLPPL
jgi:hypothetical protein